MTDWPIPIVDTLPTIHPWLVESIGAEVSMGLTVFRLTASAVYPVANQALYIPFTVSRQILVVELFSYNGNPVNGNIDVGIYDIEGNRLVSSGSVAQAGVNTLQIFDVADTLIGPGRFYLAVSMDNIVGTLQRGTLFANIAAAVTGMAEEAAAFPLPATATFAQITGNYIPVIGLSLKTTI